MISISYQKRKNQELFKSMEDKNGLFLSNTQNYIPTYKRFFSLNETNYNNINLNNKWYISNIIEPAEDELDPAFNIFSSKLKNTDTNKVKEKDVFFKLAPLVDPFKYLVGKYDAKDQRLFSLPNISSNETTVHPKMLDVNNSAYVDSFFLYLSSNLLHKHKFINGVDFYGSYLAMKNNYVVNVFDDIDYLVSSDYFVKNKNVLYQIENYDHLFDLDENEKLKPIQIGDNISVHSNISAKSINDDMFEGVFEDTPQLVDLNDLKEMSINMEEIIIDNLRENTSMSLKSNSMSDCSSRTSYTGSHNEDCSCCDHNEIIESEELSGENNMDLVIDTKNDIVLEHEHVELQDDSEIMDSSEVEEDSEGDEDDFEERIDVTLPKFPVHVIGMENCEDTFDNLMMSNELSPKEWIAALMQVIMTLLVYQKAFSFTHNDLHTNNIMYNYTDKKYLYYKYNDEVYKVPTYGKIFKIIDFGRSIYKFNGNLFCSDSFQPGGDAATQYNTEPYFNEKKPRLEPNFSFDLCRLACSIFDYVILDLNEVKDLDKCTNPIQKLITEWCLDDNGLNVLYKANGDDRYPDFKLYKMIARCVHNHTPDAQLERPEFKSFIYKKGSGNEKMDDIIDIDSIPSYI